MSRRCGLIGFAMCASSFSPLNVRYATDSTNMQVWCTHNAVRYAFVAAEGPVVLFDFHGSGHLSDHLPLIDEVRAGQALAYFFNGDGMGEAAKRWADEIADLVRSHGGGKCRLAVDKADPLGTAGLERAGLTLVNGQEVMELARVIKSEDEIRAMRCAIAAAESGMAAMQAHLRPGMTEQDLWSHLHNENIKRGGEWIETRLLVDASLVAASRQRNSKGEKDAIKAGKSADEIWPDLLSKAAQKNTDVRWTMKITRGKVEAKGKAQPDIAIPAFGYKSQISIDARHGFIRRQAIKDAGYLRMTGLDYEKV